MKITYILLMLLGIFYAATSLYLFISEIRSVKPRQDLATLVLMALSWPVVLIIIACTGASFGCDAGEEDDE